jgi:tungstate transport system substrate-binding protein
LKRLLIALFLFVVSLSVTACGTSSSNNKKLLLISTTSTQDSGLLDVLLPAFEKQSGYQVQLVSVGSGQALQMAEEGNADVLLVHSPAAEKDFMAQGFGMERRLVMHNDFVLVGPASDPAGIKGKTLPEALKAIYESGATFVSRGDQSGTNVKELALWKTAGLDPATRPWYLETGQGQGATLSIASEKGGYALTDRGTFLAYRANVALMILVEGDASLLNVYHVITVNPEKWPKVNLAGAQAFADFITSAQGQQIIRDFGVGEYGQPLFYPDAGKTDAELGLP